MVRDSAGKISMGANTLMSDDEVLRVVAALLDRHVLVWIGGGWGIDALLGHQTRDHADLDLAINAKGEALTLDTLSGIGYRQIPNLDWRPVRIGLHDARGHQVDLHPVTFDKTGHGLQANLDGLPPFEYPAKDLAHGAISGTVVPCISAELQARFHSGYVLSKKDHKDMDLLRSRFPEVSS